MIVKKGANYGYPLREGPQAMSVDGMAAVPPDNTIPVQITARYQRDVKPTCPVIAYPHTSIGGDAIAGGFVYRGSRIPALNGKLLFGDITTGHVWYAEMADVLRADDGDPTTRRADARGRRRASSSRRGRPSALVVGVAARCPGAAAVAGRGRVDLRFAVDNAGELYVLTKSDGMIRQVVGLH